MRSTLSIARALCRFAALRVPDENPDGVLEFDENGRMHLPTRVTAKVRACRARARERRREKNAAKKRKVKVAA